MENITLKGGYVKTKIDEIHDYNQKVNRGAGVKKSKKGKGSYTRKAKHKKFSCNEFLSA
ncbi:MAG: hypothetical protein ACRC2K_14045 [Clostridium sp.]